MEEAQKDYDGQDLSRKDLNEVADYIEMDSGTTKLCRFGKYCRDRNGDKCTYDHGCRRKKCELGDRCKYNHHSSRPRKLKKDIVCKFLKNCREKENCEYFHPKAAGVINPKNWQKEMYENVHFLTEQVKKLTKDLEKIRTSRKRE